MGPRGAVLPATRLGEPSGRPRGRQNDATRLEGQGVAAIGMGGIRAHTIRFLLPLRLVNGANEREHPMARARRAREHRQVGAASATGRGLAALAVTSPGLVVTITRIGPKPLDSDNLAISGKHLRDGIADAAGVDDGSPWWTWQYAQRSATKAERASLSNGKFGVEVVIESRPVSV